MSRHTVDEATRPPIELAPTVLISVLPPLSLGHVAILLNNCDSRSLLQVIIVPSSPTTAHTNILPATSGIYKVRMLECA